MRITLDPALRAVIAAKSEKAAAAVAAATANVTQKPVENVTSIDMDEAEVPEEAILSNINEDSTA